MPSTFKVLGLILQHLQNTIQFILKAQNCHVKGKENKRRPYSACKQYCSKNIDRGVHGVRQSECFKKMEMMWKLRW